MFFRFNSRAVFGHELVWPSTLDADYSVLLAWKLSYYVLATLTETD